MTLCSSGQRKLNHGKNKDLMMYIYTFVSWKIYNVIYYAYSTLICFDLFKKIVVIIISSV